VSFKCIGVGSLSYVRALFSTRAVIILSPKIRVPALRRVPPEIWDRVASFIPRYFLRTWLSVSRFHRDIALRHVFHTVDLYLGEDSNWNHTLDIFDRVRMDPLFSRRIKALRIHWAYAGGDMLEVMSSECEDCRFQNSSAHSFQPGIFRTALPEFRALEEFEWIGYPELRADTVQALLQSHPNLVKLGLVYISTTCQVSLARSHIFLEDGTLTLSAFLDSLPSSALLFAQKMMMVLLI
jgi:hypothetical protein